MPNILSGIATSIVIAFCAASFGTAVAADDKRTEKQKDQASAEYKAAKKQAEANYKSATQRCDKMKGNEKDVCMQQAKADRKKAEADAEALRDTKSARAEAGDDKRKADYRVAREKCENLSGNAKDACVKDAQAKYGRN
ncbi:MAG: hypothetical protein ACT4P8_02640 [Betaproteobacteria bacterium]